MPSSLLISTRGRPFAGIDAFCGIACTEHCRAAALNVLMCLQATALTMLHGLKYVLGLHILIIMQGMLASGCCM